MELAELKSRIKGNFITPESADYDKARAVFYGGIDNSPAAIVQAKNTEDVVQTVNFAREHGLDLSIRSGGHSIAGYSASQGGIVLDLRHMRSLEVDESSEMAWVEPGLTAGEYSKELDKYSLATGFGDTGSVGIGGITLGGGIGYLARKYGLAIDNLLAAEIVTADGRLLHVDADNHPDLFWAIRGGGGNFGVITRLKFKLRKTGDCMGGILILPAEPKVLADFMAEADKAPEELSVIVNVMPAMPMPFLPEDIHGQMVIMALMMYVGDEESGKKVYEPFLKLAKPLADMIKPMRYPDIFMPEDDSYHPTAVSRTMFLDSVDEASAKVMLDYLETSDAPVRVIQLRALGGAVARVGSSETAFAHRDSKILANVAAFYDTPENQKIREVWVIDFVDAIRQSDDGAYVGFVGKESGQLPRVYPQATLERLRQVKQTYDPGNLFKFNVNVSPSNI